MPGADLPSDSNAIVDTSVLFAMGSSNDTYQAFEEYVTGWNVAVRIPDTSPRN